jgi:hypothetical protein
MNTELQNVLVVFEEVPDRTRIFDFSVDQEKLEKLVSLHGCIVNTTNITDEQDALFNDFFFPWIESSEPIFDTQKEQDQKVPQIPAGKLVFVGFIL